MEMEGIWQIEDNIHIKDFLKQNTQFCVLFFSFLFCVYGMGFTISCDKRCKIIEKEKKCECRILLQMLPQSNKSLLLLLFAKVV